MSKIKGYGDQMAALVPFYVPSGTINGSNVTFTLTESPITSTATVGADGVLISPSEFSISNNTLTMNVPPTDTLVISYWIPA